MDGFQIKDDFVRLREEEWQTATGIRYWNKNEPAVFVLNKKFTTEKKWS